MFVHDLLDKFTNTCHSRESLHAPLCHTGPTTEVCFGFYNHCNVLLARSSHLTVINPHASPPSGRNAPTRSSIAELMDPFQIRVLGMCMYCNICVTESENREKQLVLVYCGTMWNALYTYSPTHTHTHPHTHTHTCTHTHTRTHTHTHTHTHTYLCTRAVLYQSS